MTSLEQMGNSAALRSTDVPAPLTSAPVVFGNACESTVGEPGPFDAPDNTRSMRAIRYGRPW
ncbi:MAG: hypothetical protein WDO68_30800 [Gammaproteobacteria bacterium]